jgi:uncharacterized protein (TIGR02118 family)
MAKLLVLYDPPKDPAAFETYYRNTHVPLARKIAGVRRIEVSAGPVMSPQGPAPYHLVAELSFDSMAELQAALASPEGQAAAADLANFATGGVTLLTYEVREP